MLKRQRGVALSSLIVWGIVLVLVAVLGMKVLPSYIEYFKILKDVKGAANQVKGESTVADVRRAFDRFTEIDGVKFNSQDLEISKDGGRVVIEFAYDREIPIFWNVSLLIHYQGSSAATD